jgi:hypothetical protein
LFWSVLLLALLFPWQHLLSAPDLNIPGAFCSVIELDSVSAADRGALQARVADYARFIGYPILAILIAFVASLRFCRSYRIARQGQKQSKQPQQTDE